MVVEHLPTMNKPGIWALSPPSVDGQSHKNVLSVALIVEGQMVRGSSKSLAPH